MAETNPEFPAHQRSELETRDTKRYFDDRGTQRLAQLEALFASVPVGVLVLDGHLRVGLANNTMADLVGVPAIRAGQSLDAVLPHVAETLVPRARRVLETGRGVELSLSAPISDDRATVAHWTAALFPIGRPSSNPHGVGLVIQDVTERTRVSDREAQHARHREGLHALTAALVEAITPEEVVRATVRHATAALDAVGTVVARCTPDQAHIELLDAEGMPPDVAAEWRRFPTTAPVPLAYVARTGESLFLESAQDWELQFPEVAALARDIGHPANAVVPLMIEGRPVGALGIAFATSRRFDDDDRALVQTVARQCALALERARLLDSERAARAAAVKASALKTKFMATMSHELRTPLQAIVGYADLLEMEIHGPLTGEQHDALSRIHRNLQHLLHLVGGVLSLIRAESGQVQYALTEVSVEHVLRFVAEATAPQTAAKQLRTEHLGGRDLLVRADGEKLRQIMLNLFSNAIKFTAEGGTITSECSADGEQVRVEVRDTGRGIAPDQLERVFEPFVQVGRPLNQPTEGSGLGLAISREFARGMGGELSVRSELGVGSTFTLVLPAANSAITKPAQK